ncbi:hypothetical protein SUGI_0660120 [Cryptomeria japonica]|uniref:E3 ubiquitin-protein ligase RING1-like n=1 Tax=Cryptomeria japonica TaxID=3369 RepID=UPI002414949C|nr:E3 ubiquitin-protein ligase RING1-like [Cryptomeria japonica]XP_057849997.2 E3 ubiquitin-protein ligase RING1-like [Cryptomeria japonica]XP_057849999.2 E3 ubiquitin-protein ligase RING1-like [Cryptomeria japonica]XP_057850000.2 E3 ubiquitin-protein ligase RING1-like [Cryptomeria japonica]XP_057850001.2 E3 ubiquitin-protein ligase RING1-like [Cryptomeria japonica]GLJ32784.1 hypothetical protein SUGI_0660120 [Cryptomeria japonica]
MSGGGGEGQRYWCHLCDTMVTPLLGAGEEVTCAQCHGGFVEEMESPHPIPPPPSAAEGEATHNLIGDGRIGDFFSRMMERHIGAALGGPEAATATGGTGFNHMMLMPGGGSIQIVFDHSGRGGGGEGGGGGIRFPATIGDYYLGGGLEQLIQQLAENDPNRYGTPPAAKAAVQDMPVIKITEEHLTSDAGQCAVCKDTFEEGSEARQMPCKHIYHPDCILPWLELHSTCPVCRYEMPPEESSNPSEGSNARPVDTAGGASGVGGRRFMFQFPLRSRDAAPGGSSSGQDSTMPPRNANDNDNSGGDQPMSEARHEDLD